MDNSADDQTPSPPRDDETENKLPKKNAESGEDHITFDADNLEPIENGETPVENNGEFRIVDEVESPEKKSTEPEENTESVSNNRERAANVVATNDAEDEPVGRLGADETAPSTSADPANEHGDQMETTEDTESLPLVTESDAVEMTSAHQTDVVKEIDPVPSSSHDAVLVEPEENAMDAEENTDNLGGDQDMTEHVPAPSTEIVAEPLTNAPRDPNTTNAEPESTNNAAPPVAESPVPDSSIKESVLVGAAIEETTNGDARQSPALSTTASDHSAVSRGRKRSILGGGDLAASIKRKKAERLEQQTANLSSAIPSTSTPSVQRPQLTRLEDEPEIIYEDAKPTPPRTKATNIVVSRVSPHSTPTATTVAGGKRSNEPRVNDGRSSMSETDRFHHVAAMRVIHHCLAKLRSTYSQKPIINQWGARMFPCDGCGSHLSNKTMRNLHANRIDMCLMGDCIKCKKQLKFGNICSFMCHVVLHERFVDRPHQIDQVFSRLRVTEVTRVIDTSDDRKRLENLADLYEFESGKTVSPAIRNYYNTLVDGPKTKMAGIKTNSRPSSAHVTIVPLSGAGIDQRQACTECNKTFTHFDRHFVCNNQGLDKLQMICGHRPTNKSAQCTAVFFSDCSLRAHRRVHLGGHRDTFTCAECCSNFKTEKDLTKHSQTHLAMPVSVRAWRCPQCTVFFSNRVALIVHHLKEHNKPKFGCNVCNRLFETQQQCESHVEAAHAWKRFGAGDKIITMRHMCHLCTFFGDRDQMITHQKTKHYGSVEFATPINILRCPMCGRLLESLAALTRHYQTMHKQLVKNIVPRQFDPPLKMQAITTERPSVTEKRGSTITWPQIGHAIDSSRRQTTITSQMDPPADLRCVVCGHAFGSAFLLQLHKKTVHKQQLTPSQMRTAQ